MILAPVWTRERLSDDAARSLATLEEERAAEMAQWRALFDSHHKEFIHLLHELGPGDPGKLWPEKVAEIFAKNLGNAFRALTGPPISKEDLRALARVSPNGKALTKDPEGARRVLEIIRQRLDDRRFPWIADKRPPTHAEQHMAAIASAAMMSMHDFITGRPLSKEAAQEKTIREFVMSLGYREVPTRRITYLEEAPLSGEFCGRCFLGGKKADITLRLSDERVLAIECIISNNAASGNKQIAQHAIAKARTWYEKFGPEQIVAVLALAGAFDTETLLQAQSTPLAIFWSHDLFPLRDFVAECGSSAFSLRD